MLPWLRQRARMQPTPEPNPRRGEAVDEQEAETTQMTQAPVGTTVSTNINREVAAISRARRAWRFLQSKRLSLCLVLGAGVIIAFLAVKLKLCGQRCPNEWVGYRNKCYFISREEKNWTSSRTFCNNNESSLATLENQEEMDSLVEHFKTDEFWIGLRRKGESFFWENGIALKVDLFPVRNHSECAYLHGSTISTSACSLPRRWICVRPR